MVRIAILALLLAPGAAAAGSVTVRNGGAETVSGIHMSAAGSGSVGENRMRSQLPPGAEARITYSTGCRADVRIAFSSGRTEDHAGLDVCTDPRITTGQNGVAGPAMTATPVLAGSPPKATSQPAPIPAKAAAVVPPWTGKSITKRFGGLD